MWKGGMVKKGGVVWKDSEIYRFLGVCFVERV